MSLFRTRPWHLAPRLSAGAMILSAGLDKIRPEPEQANGTHGMATGTYPFLAEVDPQTFTHRLGQAEVALGAALVTPAVPTSIAAGALTAFSAGLLGLYLRTPGMRRPASLRPTPQGTALAKDIWLLGIGAGLLTDTLLQRNRRLDG